MMVLNHCDMVFSYVSWSLRELFGAIAQHHAIRSLVLLLQMVRVLGGGAIAP